MDPYVLLSPVGITRRYALDNFLDGISRLDPAPDRVVFAVDADAPSDMVSKLSHHGEILTIQPDGRPGYLSRIAPAREALREWFISSGFTFSLWLDSDIVVPPNLPLLLWKYHKRTRVSVVVHCYPGRSPGAIWHGSGIMFMHRIGAQAGRFIVTSVEGMNISEDYNFFSLVSGAEPILKTYFGVGGVAKVCIVRNVLHYLEPNLEPSTIPEKYFAKHRVDLGP